MFCDRNKDRRTNERHDVLCIQVFQQNSLLPFAHTPTPSNRLGHNVVWCATAWRSPGSVFGLAAGVPRQGLHPPTPHALHPRRGALICGHPPAHNTERPRVPREEAAVGRRPLWPDLRRRRRRKPLCSQGAAHQHREQGCGPKRGALHGLLLQPPRHTTATEDKRDNNKTNNRSCCRDTQTSCGWWRSSPTQAPRETRRCL